MRLSLLLPPSLFPLRRDGDCCGKAGASFPTSFPPSPTSLYSFAGSIERQQQVYNALHEDAAAKGQVVEVGIVKDLFQFHAYRWYNVLDHLLAWLCDKLFNQVRDYCRADG